LLELEQKTARIGAGGKRQDGVTGYPPPPAYSAVAAWAAKAGRLRRASLGSGHRSRRGEACLARGMPKVLRPGQGKITLPALTPRPWAACRGLEAAPSCVPRRHRPSTDICILSAEHLSPEYQRNSPLSVVLLCPHFFYDLHDLLHAGPHVIANSVDPEAFDAPTQGGQT